MANKFKRTAKFLGSSSLTSPLLLLGTASALLGSNPALAIDAGTLPQGGTVTGGSATIATSGQTLTVNQTSSRAVIDWRSFNIGANAQANFNQPNSGSIAVNRVNGSTDPSQIDGGLHANGQVWILNPNGVLFGTTAHVDAAGIVATTANIDAKAFMAGSNSLQMTGGDSGQVVNQGSITVGQSGLAAFVAPTVRNSGTIRATVGKVVLAAGDTYTLDLAGDHLVEIGLGATKAVVDQSGKIVNPGGTIAITAKAASQVVDSVINMSGVTDASSVKTVGGNIVLAADDITTTATSQIKADAGTNGDGGSISAVANNTGDYAGSFSAKGGSVSGEGGSIETSGQTVSVAANAKVNASAPNGRAGKWSLDPLNVTITSGTGGALTGGTVTTGAIQSSLAGGTSVDITTSQTGPDAGDLTLAASINATSINNAGLTLEGRHLSATGGSTISISGGALVLDVNTVNTMSNAPTSWVNDAIAMVGSVSGGTTINLGAAAYTYSPTSPLAALGALITVNKSNLTLNGVGATIDVNPATVSGGQLDAISIAGGTTGVTIEDFNIQGEITGSYVTYNFGSNISRGIAVSSSATNFKISDNSIENIRTGILVDGRNNTGSITDNFIDNTKSALSIQYTDGTGLTVTGNSQGSYGNEWGEILHLNGYYSGGTTYSNPYGTNAPTSVQTQLLADATANSGWTVEDQAYTSSNRTAVTVGPTGSDSNQGSPRSQLATIQAGINDVVVGGTVTVNDGTYVVSSGYINVNKSLSLIGENEADVIIDARNASTYGLRVTATGGPVDLENFTLYGVTASGGYGLKAEATDGLTLAHVTSEGAYKSEFDLNGVVNGTLNYLTANGDSVGTTTPTAGNGISLTDSQNITITNSVTENNLWGGLALYQGTTYGSMQLTAITVDGTNTFNEANGIYAQDQSSVAIGAINLAGQGIQYVAQLTTPVTSGDGTYTFFQRTQQGAIDQGAGLNAKYTVTGATVQGYAGTSLNGNNVFTVGHATDGDALSVNAALNQSFTGGVINVLSGAYAENVAIQAPRTVNFGSVTLSSLTSGTGAAGSVLSGNVAAGSVVLNGATVLGGNLTLDTSASNGTVTLAAVDGSTVGGQALTILTGSGVLSLGNVGATTTLGSLTAGNVTLAGSTYDAGTIGLGAATLTGNTALAGNSVNLASVDGTSAGSQSLTVAANTVSLGNVGATTALGSLTAGNVALTGSTYDASTIGLGAATLSGNATLTGNSVTLASVNGTKAGSQSLTVAANTVSLGNVGATTALGTLTAGNVTLTGSTYDASTIGLGAATLSGNATLTGNSVALASVNGTKAGSQSLTVAANSGSLGNVGATTALSALTAGNVTLTGSTYDASAIGLGAATLSGNTTFTGNSVALASVDGAKAGSQSLTIAANTVSLGNVGATTVLGTLTAGNVTLTGSTYDASTIGLGAVTLSGNATLAGNSVALASVDGTKAGSQSLTVTGNTATLGNLGATTRLGAVNVAANATLSGTNDAASFTFGGSVTLTAASTVLDTTLSSAAAGDITFTGAIFGTGDSGQSLTLSAGPGTGAASTNGDITMANAGTTTVRLGTLSVSGNNFTALTVDLAGDFTSRLTGDQVFAADTLNAGGNVNTQAGGNVSGHIVSSGTVALTTPGIVSGNIGGSSLVLNSGSVSNATLTGSSVNANVTNGFNATVNASNSANIAANAISGNIGASSLVLNSGSVSNATLTGNSVNANVTNGFNATVNATNNANIAANTISGNIGANTLVLNSGSVSNATLTGNSVNANVTNGFNATVNATTSANITANTISGSISGAALTIGGGLVSNATLSGTTVTANVTGGFDATVNAGNSASIAANTISGNFSGATVSLSGQSVSGQVSATTLNVASQGGTVAGDFTPGNVTGFVDLNGQTTSGGPRVPGQQLVVENFALPAGTQIATNGALILPQGLVIGLLSPGGGPAKVIMVHDVQTLGQLLAEGYVAIVIDLKNGKNAPVTVASN